MSIHLEDIPQHTHLFLLFGLSAGILIVVLLLRRCILRRLLLYEWRYYLAFKYLCSRTTRRPIEDISDLTFREKILLFRRYKESDFISLQAHLEKQAEEDPTLIRNTHTDHYVLLRTFVTTLRRILYVILLFSVLAYIASRLHIHFIPDTIDTHWLLSLLIPSVLLLAAYALFLYRRLRRLRRNYPLAYLELTEAQGTGRLNRLSKMERLAIRTVREYRIRQDSHTPIAKQFSLIVRRFPKGVSAYLRQIEETEEELLSEAHDLRERIDRKTPIEDLLSKMHDDLYLQVIQLCIWNSEKIILLDNTPKTEDLNSLVLQRQDNVFQLAHELRNNKAPEWQFIRHVIPFGVRAGERGATSSMLHIPEIAFQDLPEKQYPESIDYQKLYENIQTLLYFASERLKSRHIRIVVTPATELSVPDLTPSSLVSFLQKRGFSNIQQGYGDLNLRKQNDPDLIVFLLRLTSRVSTYDEMLARLLASTPMNLICVTLFRICTAEEYAKASELRREKESDVAARLSLLTKNWERLASIPFQTRYRFVSSVFDGMGYEATADDLNIRSLLAHLKKHGLDNPDATYVKELVRLLQETFGRETAHLTLFPIPPASAHSYRTKFMRLTAALCAQAGIDNAYAHLRYIKDFVPQRPHEQGNPTLSIDWNYLTGRHILLFDDVVTSGKSSTFYAQLLQKRGINVVGLLSIAQTKIPIPGRNEESE
ncbi:MAG: phosphoribosyltransferase [Paludibacteraceae bacterium]|nr:phosphoribosyltransferase [Paludibacteraceae bacterium]